LFNHFMDFTNPANLLIAGLYYALVGILSFFAIFGIYVLIRYGHSRFTALGVSILFAVIYLGVLSNSYRILVSILS
jgi:hypothetical protein